MLGGTLAVGCGVRRPRHERLPGRVEHLGAAILPALTALTGVVLIVFGFTGGWPPLVIVGALLLVLAALGFLTGSQQDSEEPPAGGSPGARV